MKIDKADKDGDSGEERVSSPLELAEMKTGWRVGQIRRVREFFERMTDYLIHIGVPSCVPSGRTFFLRFIPGLKARPLIRACFQHGDLFISPYDGTTSMFKFQQPEHLQNCAY